MKTGRPKKTNRAKMVVVSGYIPEPVLKKIALRAKKTNSTLSKTIGELLEYAISEDSYGKTK